MFPLVRCERDTLALFSISNCQPDNKLHCQNAAINEKTMKQAHQKAKRPYHLCTIDVQNSNKIAVDVMLDLINFDQVDFSGKCRSQTNDSVILQLSEVLLFTYVPFEMTRLISSLLLVKGVDVTMVSITTQQMYPFLLLEKDTFIYSYESSFQIGIQKKAIQYLKNEYNISYMAVIYFKESDKDIETVRKPCEDRPETPFCFYVNADKIDHKDCIKELFLDISDNESIKRTMRFMEEDPNLRVLLTYGFGSTIFRFEHHPIVSGYANVYRGDFYITYFERVLTDVTSLDQNGNSRWKRAIINIPGEHSINEFLSYVYDFENMLVKSSWMFLALENSGVIDEFTLKYENVLRLILKDWKSGDRLTFEDWKRIPEIIRRKIAAEISQNRLLVKKFIEYWKSSNYISFISPDELLKMRLYSPKKALEAKPYCNMTIPSCGKGFELKHSLYKEDFWNNSYGWHCSKCLPMTFKNIDGNSKCKQCKYPYRTDEARIKCFDPYAVVYLQMFDSTLIILSIVSGINLLSILLTMVWFWRYRETPIVKNANLKVTMLHLSSHLMLSIAPVYLFLGKPTRVTCLLRPLVIGICFTINVSVNLGKTQKLNLIFKSKTLHSESEKRLIEGIEFIVISILVILDIFIFAITYINQTIEVIFTIDEESTTKEMTCNNNGDIIVHLSFVLILVLANGIQAVRSRKLPSHFKETTHVIYSSFISVIVFAALVVIYFMQKKELTKSMVLAFSVSILNSIHFGLIYSYKMYVIVFKPDLNTKAVFNERRKKEFDARFETPIADGR